MATQTINVTVNPEEIDVAVGNNQINATTNPKEVSVQIGGSVTTANFILADGKFYLDGSGGNTYLKYNSSTQRVEMWVNGVKQKEWGTYAGVNPFA